MTHLCQARYQKIAMIACLALALACPARAEDISSNPQAVRGQIQSMQDVTNRDAAVMRELFKFFGEEFNAISENVGRAVFYVRAAKLADTKKKMPFYYEMQGMFNDGVASRLTSTQAFKALNDTVLKTISGHAHVDNAQTGGGTKNAASGSAVQLDAFIFAKMQQMFCIPQAVDATPECAARAKDPNLNPAENFIDFFLSEKTWSSAAVIDAMLVARRLFSNNEDKVQFGYDTSRDKFVNNQAYIAQDNMRMTILNHLAARRAPTSDATQSVLSFMFQTLAASTGMVATVNPDEACKSEWMTPKDGDSDDLKAVKFMNSYVCSYTSQPLEGGKRIISQAAIDKIMQHDFYLSPTFYGNINASYNNQYSIEKMEVFMKAQQVVQDYQALRLLQMKTAALAMNIMNE